jgi:hypothetical protein
MTYRGVVGHRAGLGAALVVGLLIGIGALASQKGGPSTNTQTRAHLAQIELRRPMSIKEVLVWTAHHSLRPTEVRSQFPSDGETITAAYVVPATATNEDILRGYRKELDDFLAGLADDVASSSGAEKKQLRGISRFRGTVATGGAVIRVLTVEGNPGVLVTLHRDPRVKLVFDLDALRKRNLENQGRRE